jgi:DNA-binding response OmpR family regulator
MKLLVVEDDVKVSRFLVRVLHEEGYVTDACATGQHGVEQGRAGGYDLILLDWMLPDLDGLSVCRELRGLGVATPILMLTARGETSERVLGLEAGADDYVVKPFEIEELVARVRALLRRSAGFACFRCGDIEIDRLGHRASLVGRPLDLTAREYALLLQRALTAASCSWPTRRIRLEALAFWFDCLLRAPPRSRDHRSMIIS